MALSVLMFGASGQVAVEIIRCGGPDLAVTALDRAAADLTDPAACAARVAAADCDVVINAAAYTAVDRAEQEEALAFRVNAEAPGAIARACAERGLPFLHVSTDYVFDGSGAAPWREDMPTGPIGAYGRSKLAGEQAVAAAGGAHVILRTAWVHAAHGANFVAAMLRAATQRSRLSVVDDQRGGPTAAADVARTLLRVAAAFRDGQGVSGVFHYCGAPTVSWHGFACAIFERADWIARPELAPIPSSAWPTPAARPANSALDCAKIAAAYGVAQPDWRASLDLIMAELRVRAR